MIVKIITRVIGILFILIGMLIGTEKTPIPHRFLIGMSYVLLGLLLT